MYMMLTGRPLYRGPTDEAFLLLALNGAPGLLSYYSEEFGLVLPPSLPALLARMLCVDVKERITLEEVMGMEWVREGGREGEVEEEEGREGGVVCWSPATTVEDEMSVGGGEEEEEEEEDGREGGVGVPLLVLPPLMVVVVGREEEEGGTEGREGGMMLSSPALVTLMQTQ